MANKTNGMITEEIENKDIQETQDFESIYEENEEILDNDDSDNLEEFAEEEAVRKSDERENAIEWYTGHTTMTVTLTQRKLINRISEYARQYPDEVQIIKVNDDGTILAHVPLRYLKFKRPRDISDERRQEMRERAYKNIAEGKLHFGGGKGKK